MAEPTMEYALNWATTLALRFVSASPKWIQSVVPSAVRFTAVGNVVTAPCSEPVPLVVTLTRFVRLKLADVATPATLAITMYVPDFPLATRAGAVATPFAPVKVSAVARPEKLPLGPVVGAVNVTAAPLTGTPELL